MSSISKLICGVVLITIPTIQFGGYFLLRVLSGKMQRLALTDFQKSMFRAGHAHAGVLVILSLVAQILTDYARLPGICEWFARIGFPLAAILVSVGFFASAIGPNRTSPNKFILILYCGIAILAISAIILGLGLLESI